MRKFFVYCNTNQAHEALTYNDILCAEMKKDLRQVATLSFMSDKFIFLSSEKINAAGRSCGVSEQGNQYPVTLEISGIEDCCVQVYFVTRGQDGKYKITDEPRPLSEYNEIDDCIGAFVYGHIPFSLVSKVIFENDENRERFARSGYEVWFPEDIYSLWTDENYKELGSHSVDQEELWKTSRAVNARVAGNMDCNLHKLLLKRLHEKTAYYCAVEATQSWQIGKLKTNVDGALISMLDNGSESLRKLAEDQLRAWADMFDFGCRNLYSSQDDRVLEDVHYLGYKVFKTISEELCANEIVSTKRGSTNGDNLKRSIECVKSSYFEAKNDTSDVADDVAENAKYQSAIDAISTFMNSRLSDADKMLEATKNIDLLYALAMCIKNKGDISKIRESIDTDISQRTKRYLLILAGLASNMSDICGSVKSNRALERTISNAVNSKFVDEESMLIKPRCVSFDDVGIDLKPQIAMSLAEFKEYIQSAPEEIVKKLYKKELAERIPAEEVSTYKNPIDIFMDEKHYKIDSLDAAEKLKKDLDKKLKTKTSEPNKALIVQKLFDPSNEHCIERIYNKYAGQ